METTRRDIIRLCHAGLDSRTLMIESIKRLRVVIPIDASFFATADPATLLFTGSVADDVLIRATPQFLANEFLQDDANKFRWLARNHPAVQNLDRATHHQLEHSARYREILAPMALGDELRAALGTNAACWGFMCLHRERSGTPFNLAEAAFLEQLSPHLAEGLRTALLIGGVTDSQISDGPGLLVLADNLALIATTPAAECWLAEIAEADWPGSRELPTAIYAVVARLQALERDNDALARQMPRVRLRTRSGQWLVLHASRMSGPASPGSIAVILEVAQAVEIAPLIIQAYDLSKREGEITLCAVRGLSTAEIASELHISANTVQDHLKAIFDRVGVRSRRELIARIFTQQYQPRIAAGSQLDPHGQFS